MDRTDEDHLAANALGKTIAFLLYAVLVPLLLMPVFLNPRFESMPETWKNLTVVLLVATILLLLVVLVVKGILPGSGATFVQPFNEKQIGIGMTVLSAATWLLTGESLVGQIIQWAINGGLLSLAK